MVDPKKRLLRNITSNWVQMAVYTVIALVMTPFLVHSLGKEIYGIWALIYSIVHYSNFFDAGFKQSLARYLPKYYATNDYDKLNEVINSANLIYAVSGTLVIGGITVVAVYFVSWFGGVSPEHHNLMRWALIIMGLNQGAYFFLMSGTALGPFHRYDLLNVIEISRTLLGTAVVIWLLVEGYGLVALAIVTFGSNFAGLLVKRFFQQRLVPQIKYSIKYISKERIRELFNYGGISFLIVMAWIVIFSTDNIVVAKFVSAEAVAYIAIAATVINNLRSIISAVGTPLVPAISHLDATSDLAEIAALHRKIIRYLYYLSTLICVGIIFFADQFITLWMGDGFTTTVHLLLILIAPACIYLPQMMSNSVLLGIGKHRTLLYVLAIEGAANIILSLALVGVWGVYGVALGTAIPQLIIYSVVYPVVFHRAIRASLREFYLDSLKSVLVALLFTLPVAWAVLWLPIDGWLGFIIRVGLVSAVSLGGFLWRMLEREDRKRITDMVSRSRPTDPVPGEVVEKG